MKSNFRQQVNRDGSGRKNNGVPLKFCRNTKRNLREVIDIAIFSQPKYARKEGLTQLHVYAFLAI